MTQAKPVVLVTGGSAGIGAQICRDLLDSGHYVLNLSLEKSKTQHADLHDVEVDLADVDATANVVSELAATHDITGIVHNAGVIRAALIEDVDLADVQYLVDLHIKASITIVQGALDAMKRAGFGRIVVISSRAVLGLETRSGYSATKAAQIGLVRTWAMELGKYGITANAIAPGPIVTDMFTAVVPEGSEMAQKIADSLPVKRLGRPEDISRVVGFLLQPDSGFITGQCIFVCGGASLGSLSL